MIYFFFNQPTVDLFTNDIPSVRGATALAELWHRIVFIAAYMSNTITCELWMDLDFNEINYAEKYDIPTTGKLDLWHIQIVRYFGLKHCSLSK